ncbi:transcription elongation factor GreA [Psychrobacter luti]|uniref:Transcription elongation factor GreA n=1 Tax=Psychrobacter luti TaxID=198481 RepID=A0A839T9L2_9GAMM|nr:GreA/GreB family elongation factor [Psychrobacter luti]MBB3106121.1 transcription elongation factor GreA [Psychrobacter luti]
MTQSTKIYMTETGFDNLKSLLARKKQEYADVRDHRQVAFEMSGDGWHDNPEFNRQQQLEANLNHTVKELTERLQHARPVNIDPSNRPTNHVAIGSLVSITRWNLNNDINDKGLEETWEIVGFDETDIKAAKIGYNAPLAKSIIGLQVGDVSEQLVLGTQAWEIEVIAIHPSS